MDSLKQAVEESSMLITILDPSTFDSEWVRAENAWAADAGLPILAFYDADRQNWHRNRSLIEDGVRSHLDAAGEAFGLDFGSVWARFWSPGGVQTEL